MKIEAVDECPEHSTRLLCARCQHGAEARITIGVWGPDGPEPIGESLARQVARRVLAFHPPSCPCGDELAMRFGPQHIVGTGGRP